MNRAMTRRAALAALLAPLFACGSWDEVKYDEPWVLLPPVALEQQVAFVERSNGRVFLIDPASAALRPRVVPVAKSPAVAARRNGKDELLVLCRGERGGPGVPEEPPELIVISGDPSVAPRRIGLGSRFNALAQSADGRFVVAHFSGAVSGETLFNPNEIALVNLDDGAGVAVPRTIRSFGGVPNAVVFSPPMSLFGRTSTLAVVLSDNYVTLLDVERASNAEITVPLTLPEDRRTVRPVQVVFDAKDPTVFVRADGANDIYALRLQEVPGAERVSGGNDFRPVLGQLAAGRQPADMILYDAQDGAGTRLLVVSPGSADAHVIDARTSRATRIVLDAGANSIRLFETTAPGDPKSRLRALLLGAGTDSRLMSFLDLAGIEQQGTRNLDSRTMAAPCADLFSLIDPPTAIVSHRPQSGSPGLSVINIARRTAAPLFAQAAAARTVLSSVPMHRMWIATAAPNTHLGFIDLKTLQPGEVRLDAPIEAVLPLGAGSDGIARVVVLHRSAAGWITVLDAAQPRRETARSAAGFLLADLLERGDR